MNQEHLKFYVILIFSIFGLASCKSESPVIIQADSVKVEGLTGENSDRSFFLAQDLEVLELAGKLNIQSLQNHNFELSSLIFEIESTCQGKKQQILYAKKRRWKNRWQFDVVDLIADKALLILDDEDLYCDFTLTTTDSIGSQHKEEVNYVRITNRRDFSNLQPPLDEYGHLNYQNHLDVVLITSTKNQRVMLNCTDFHYISESKEPSLRSLSKENLKDIELTTSEQNCRLLQTYQNKTYVSKIFTLDMPIMSPTVTTQMLGLQSPTDIIENIDVVNIEIFNPNSFPIKIQYSVNNGSIFQFSPAYLYYVNLFAYLGTKIDRSIQWQTDGEFQQLEENLHQITVPAKSSAMIKGSSYMHLSCANQQINLVDYRFQNLQNNKIIYQVGFIGYNFNVKLDQFVYLYTSPSKLENLPVTLDYPIGKKIAPYPYWKVFSNLADLKPEKNYYFMGGDQEPRFFNTALEVAAFGCIQL